MKKPKYWAVSILVDATGHCVVRADNEEEAKEIAMIGFFPENDNIDLGDPVEPLDAIEITAEDFAQQQRKGREVKNE